MNGLRRPQRVAAWSLIDPAIGMPSIAIGAASSSMVPTAGGAASAPRSWIARSCWKISNPPQIALSVSQKTEIWNSWPIVSAVVGRASASEARVPVPDTLASPSAVGAVALILPTPRTRSSAECRRHGGDPGVSSAGPPVADSACRAARLQEDNETPEGTAGPTSAPLMQAPAAPISLQGPFGQDLL